MKLFRNELQILLKRKTTCFSILILTIGIVISAFLAVSQGARYTEKETIIEGREAALFVQEQQAAINGDITNANLNDFLQLLYTMNQTASFTSTEKINLFFDIEYIKYRPYVNLLLEIYAEKNEPYTTAYERLYSLGSTTHDVYEDWRQKVQTNQEGVTKQQQLDIEKKVTLETDLFHYENNSSITFMISKLKDVMLLLYIILAIILATVFSKDRLTKTDQVILTTKLGKRKLVSARFYASCIISTCLFFYTITLYSFLIFMQVGFGGFKTSIQLAISALSPYVITISQAYLSMLALAYCMCLAMSVIILYISRRTSKAYYVILCSFVFLFISYMLTQYFDGGGGLRYLMAFLPYFMCDKNFLFSYFNVYIGSISIWYPAIVGGVLLAFSWIVKYRIVGKGK